MSISTDFYKNKMRKLLAIAQPKSRVVAKRRSSGAVIISKVDELVLVL
jgi:hypothetical protein